MKMPVGVPAGGLRRHLGLRGVEDAEPAAELEREVDHRHRDHEVDQRVLDERDHRRRAQAGGVGVRRQHGEGDQQREVAGQRTGAPDADDLEHRLDADELQGDVGHRREDARQRDREAEAPGAVAALHDVGGRDVAVPVGDRPHPAQEEEDDRIQHDRVRHGEEPGDRARGPHRRGHGDERVGGVQIATEQEPGGHRAEALAAQAPLVQRVEVLRPAPAGRHEPHHRDQGEQQDQDDQGDPVDPGHFADSCSPRGCERA